MLCVRLSRCLLVVIVVLLVIRCETILGDTVYVVDGIPNTNHLVLVVDHVYRLVETVPDEIYIEFKRTVSYVDEYDEDASSIDYRVISFNCYWLKPFPSGSFYAFEVLATFVVTPLEPRCSISFNVEEHEGTAYASTMISFSMKVRVLILRIRRHITGELNIGSLILKYLLNNTEPEHRFDAVVEKRVKNSTTVATYSGVFRLNLATVVVNVFTTRMWLGAVVLTNYTVSGNLTTGVVIEPLYNVTLCGELPATFGTSLLTLASIGSSEITLRMEPGRMVCNYTVVALQPGYNRTVSTLVRSGAFTATIDLTTHIYGLRLLFPSPVAVVYKNGSVWEVVVTIPISVDGYYVVYPNLRVNATAFHNIFGSIPCSNVTINKNGTYSITCSKRYTGNVEFDDIVNSKIYITIRYTDELGYTRVITGETTVTATDPSSIAGQAWMLYNYVSNTLLLGAVMIVCMMIFSYIFEVITGRSLFRIDILRGVLLTVVVSALIFRVIIPAALLGFSAIVANIPILRNYLADLVGVEDPAVLFSRMVGYYDRLFSKIEADLNTYFIGSMNAIFAHLAFLTGIALSLFIAAMALSTPLTPGGGTPFASIASTIFSFVFGVVSILMAQIQMVAFVIAGLSVVRILVFIVTALIMVLTVVGIVMICIPTPVTQMIGEDLVSASMIFLLALPLTAPVTYAIYMHIMESSMRNIQFPFFLGFIPGPGIMEPLIKMVVYVVSAGIALLVIVSTLAVVLSRTGVATGISEALSGLVLRG